MQPQLQPDAAQPEPQPQKPQATVTTSPPAPQWDLATRTAFRFAFAFLGLIYFPFPLSSIPYVNYVAQKYGQGWDFLVVWTGKHILHLHNAVSTAETGSGDRTFDYINYGISLVIAAMAVVLWSFLDRKRPNYQKLHSWFRIYLRLGLASAMIGYGAYKVIKSQFPDLFLWRYLQPYGDSSPMGLLWTFMSFSKPYTFFAGAVEMAAGLLLLVPRLTTLGALLAMAAMGNVFMLNMSYDVPVKIYSAMLLFSAAVLVAPDLRRLINIFVLNRAAQPSSSPPSFQRRWLNHALLGSQLAFGVWFVSSSLYNSYQQYKLFNDPSGRSEFYGIWSVQEFTLTGGQQPSTAGGEGWRRVVFDIREQFWVQPINGPLRPFRLKLDSGKKSFSLTQRNDPAWKSDFTYDHAKPELLTLDGQFDGRAVHIKLERTQPQFLLRDRGFHWISEVPFNR